MAAVQQNQSTSQTELDKKFGAKRTELTSSDEELAINKQKVAKGTEFLAVISRLYIYNVIKDHRSKTSSNNPGEKESQLFDFLLNVSYPVGTDIQELNNIIDSLDACCRYLVGRDPRFYNAPFKVNSMLSSNSLRINEGRSSNIFANLLDDNKILHSFIMAMHDINRKIRLVFAEYKDDYNINFTNESDIKRNSSGENVNPMSKRRASLIDFTKSLEKKKNMEKFEYLLLSKLCAVLQLLASCCMEMYRANRIHLVKALVLAFNRIMIEEEQFVSWFATDGINVLKKLNSSNNCRIRTRTERAMNTIFPESLLLKFLKYVGKGDPIQENFAGYVKSWSAFCEDNWRALIVTIGTMFVLALVMDSFVI